MICRARPGHIYFSRGFGIYFLYTAVGPGRSGCSIALPRFALSTKKHRLTTYIVFLSRSNRQETKTVSNYTVDTLGQSAGKLNRFGISLGEFRQLGARHPVVFALDPTILILSVSLSSPSTIDSIQQSLFDQSHGHTNTRGAKSSLLV